MEFDLDPLLEFLPHVAHSLEHLRFEPPTASKVRFTPRTSRIPLEHLKSLLIKDSHVIMDHISTQNLTHFTASRPHDAIYVAKMFEGFSAPMLRSIRFHNAPLLPILNAHNFLPIFSQLESITLSGCTRELAFALQLEMLEPKESTSSQKAPKHRDVQNPFPNLKELTISETRIWTSRWTKKEAIEAIMPHLRRLFPVQGIKLVLCGSREVSTSTPEFQDDFCDEEARLFQIMRQRYMEDEDAIQYWDELYDGYGRD